MLRQVSNNQSASRDWLERFQVFLWCLLVGLKSNGTGFLPSELFLFFDCTLSTESSRLIFTAIINKLMEIMSIANAVNLSIPKNPDIHSCVSCLSLIGQGLWVQFFIWTLMFLLDAGLCCKLTNHNILINVCRIMEESSASFQMEKELLTQLGLYQMCQNFIKELAR